MKKYFKLFLLLLLIAPISLAQFSNQEYLARVGTKIISNSEFQERYEMTPGFRRTIESLKESNQLEFLFSLIAEKLWALEAASQQLDKSEVIQFSQNEFQKMFVRDALFHREVKNKISVSEQEWIEASIKNSTRLYVNYLFSTDEEEINQIYSFLSRGISFESILTESPEKEEQEDPIEVQFGQMQEDIEQALYKLKIGEFTSPFLTSDGWYIFRLVNRSQNLFLSETDKEDAKKSLVKIVEGRKLIERQLEFYSEFFKDKKVDVDSDIFSKIARSISSIILYKQENTSVKKGDPIHLDAFDVIKIENEIGEELLNKQFIKFVKDPILTKEFIRILAFNAYNATQGDINFILNSLNFQTKRIIEQELFYREGILRGYQNLPEVKSEVERWTDNYLYQVLQGKVLDSIDVTDQEVKDYYSLMNEKKEFPMVVNIVEVLTSNPEVVDTILIELKKGTDIKLLAARYSEREFTKGRNGEFGRFPISSHAEIGRAASTMEIGEVYGPLKVSEGYSIFKLIEKFEEYIEMPKPFEQVKEQYRMDIANEKAQTMFNELTYQYALKYGVELNVSELENIEVTSIPSFGIRRLGFGGKVTAVPIIAPNSDWAIKWIQSQSKQVIP